MGFTDIFKGKKSIGELEEETEHKEAEVRYADQELTLLQKQAMAERLKRSGLTPGHFSFDWKKIQQFIKSH